MESGCVALLARTMLWIRYHQLHALQDDVNRQIRGAGVNGNADLVVALKQRAGGQRELQPGVEVAAVLGTPTCLPRKPIAVEGDGHGIMGGRPH